MTRLNMASLFWVASEETPNNIDEVKDLIGIYQYDELRRDKLIKETFDDQVELTQDGLLMILKVRQLLNK